MFDFLSSVIKGGLELQRESPRNWPSVSEVRPAHS